MSGPFCSVSRCPHLAKPPSFFCTIHETENKEPSPAATAVAKQMLSVPEMMQEMSAVIQKMTERMEVIAGQMETLVKMLTTPTPPPPGLFFLNESHETHVTKSQVRKEQRIRREAKKAGSSKNDPEPSRAPARRRKSNPRSGR